MQTVLANKDEVILVKLSYLQMLVLTVKEKKKLFWMGCVTISKCENG